MLRARFARQRFPRHTHDAYVIGINERGAHETWFRGGCHLIPPLTLAIVPPGEVHTGEPVREEAWVYRAAYVAPGVLAAAASLDGCASPPAPDFPRLLIDDPELTAQFLCLHRQSEHASGPYVQTQLLCLLGTLIRRHASATPREPRAGQEAVAVRRVVEFLHAHLEQPVSLDDLANVASLSRYHLIRVFRQARGLTPYAYLIQIRVEQAKVMLRKGCAAASVAQATGFADQSHLTRVFRSLTGITPGRFARAARRV